MDRKQFLKTLVLTGALSTFKFDFFDSVDSNVEFEFELPFIGGEMVKVGILRKRKTSNTLNAQNQWSHYAQRNPAYFCPTSYYYYEEARQRYIAYLQQQQAYYNWLNQNYVNQWNNLINNRNYNRYGDASIKEHVKSMYSWGEDKYGDLNLLGLNRNAEKVVLEDASLAAAGTYEWVKRKLGEKRAQTAVSPQSSQASTKINLSKFGIGSIDGEQYYTAEGKVKITDADNFIANNGYEGQLVEVEYNNGKEYVVV
jgi:hypothetical protein